MDRIKQTFTSFLNDNTDQKEYPELIDLIILYFKSQLEDINISVLEHLAQPDCYRVLNLSDGELQFRHILLAFSEKKISTGSLLHLVDDYYLFTLTDQANRVHFVIGFTPAGAIDLERLISLCTEVQSVWRLTNQVAAKNSEAAAGRTATLISRITHDLSALASLSSPAAEKDDSLKDKIEYSHNLSRAIMLYLRDPDLHKVSVPAKDLIESIVQALPSPGKIKINMTMMNKLGSISADIEYIEQAVQAIVENAIMATRLTGDEINISIMRKKGQSLFIDYDWLEISVSDNGVGIPAEYLEEIKKPFFTTWKQEGHVGLGLAQVEKIVQAHDGTLEIHSHSSGGTTSTIYLPLKNGKD